MAYAIQVEGMDEKDYKAFVRDLPVEPGGKAKRTQGARDLMRFMGGGVVPSPPSSTAPAAEEAASS